MPSGLLVWVEGASLAGRGRGRRRRGRLVGRESRLLRFAAGTLLGLAALLLLGFATGTLLGLAALLLLALQPGALLLLAEDGRALGPLVGDRLDDQLARPDRIVVAGDHVVDGIRVAVRVDQPDDRDLQPRGLPQADRLGLQVH